MSLAPTKPIAFPEAVPDSAGIPEAVRSEMLIAPYNDADTTCSLIDKYRDEIAGIIVEPQQRIIPAAPVFWKLYVSSVINMG